MREEDAKCRGSVMLKYVDLTAVADVLEEVLGILLRR
jgi:hypothetical protein